MNQNNPEIKHLESKQGRTHVGFVWLFKDGFPRKFVYRNPTWYLKQPVLNGCLVKQPFPIERFGIIQLKQPFINRCFRFQVNQISPNSQESFFFTPIVSSLPLDVGPVSGHKSCSSNLASQPAPRKKKVGNVATENVSCSLGWKQIYWLLWGPLWLYGSLFRSLCTWVVKKNIP